MNCNALIMIRDQFEIQGKCLDQVLLFTDKSNVEHYRKYLYWMLM